MNIPNIRPNVAFYTERSKIVVDRDIDFDPEMSPPDTWMTPEEVVGEENLSQYETLCQTVIGLTSRVILLPPEKNYTRALVTDTPHGITHKPTGGYIEITGTNFRSSFNLGYVDFAYDGLQHMGTETDYFDLGHTPSAGGYVFFDDGRYYSFAAGPKVLLHDDGTGNSQLVAPIPVVEEWVTNVLQPLEDDIKSEAYVWVGDGKNIPDKPQRIV